MQTGGPTKNGQYWFLYGQADPPLTPMALRTISRLRAECRADPHGRCDARHTVATFLLVQGVDRRVVMSVFGWTSTAMTTRYQHVVPELVEEPTDA